MELKRLMPIILLVLIVIIQANIISAQVDETPDFEFLGLELEKVIMFLTGLVALVLFTITFAAYRRDKRPKLFYISIAFLLFAVKSLMLSSELFIEQIECFEPIAIVLELLALISFFYGVFRKWNQMISYVKKNEKILELELRNKIFLLVKKYAGSHLRELERRSKIPYSTLKYHLHYLVKHDLILEKQSNGKSQYYSKTIEADDIEILGLMKQKNIRRILFYLVSYDECINKDLESFIKIAPSTIIWYMKILLKKGLVIRIQKADKLVYKLNFDKIDKEKIVKILTTYKESFFDSLINRAIETWEID